MPNGIFHVRFGIRMSLSRRRRGGMRRSRSWRLPFYSHLIIDLLDAFDLFDNGLHRDSIFILQLFALQSHHTPVNANRDVSVTGGGESRLELTQQERLLRPLLPPLSSPLPRRH